MIVHACGRLPLALAMIGGLVRGRIDDGRPDAWATVIHSLETAQLDRIRFPLEDYPYSELQRAIQVSVDVLDPESQARYLGMCIFPEDTPVPERVFETLWKTDQFDVQQTVDTWIRASLARRDSDGAVVLHDLQLDYAKRVTADRITTLHQHLVDQYASARGAEWPAGPDDGYFFQRVTWHLAEAQNWPALADLVLNPTFIRAKLDTLSYLDLSQDYRWLAPCREAIAGASDRELLATLANEVNELRTFVDRREATVMAERWVKSDEGSALAVLGHGGIGKTWFMRNLWVRNFRNAVFHPVDVSRRSATSVVRFLESLLRQVGGVWHSGDGELAAAELCHRARVTLERTGAPTYVLIDGLDEFDLGPDTGRRELFECFRQLASARTRFVISSRMGVLVDELIAVLPGTRKLELVGLPADAMTDLWLQLTNDRLSIPPDDVERLLQRADGNPLIVSLMVSALKEGASVSTILEPVDTAYLVERVLRRLSRDPSILQGVFAALRELAAGGSDIFIEDVVEPGLLGSTIDVLQQSSLFEVAVSGGRHILRAANPELLPLLRNYYERNP